MAQPFQSGSPYGAPYQPSPYYNTYQPFPTQPPPSTSPFSQQNGQNRGGFQQSPNLNVGRFEANSQAQTPNQNFAFAPAPFPPEMFQQFANASVPLPPPPGFPPVPLPHLGFPQFNQSGQPPHPPIPHHQVPGFGASDVSDAYDPRYPQQLLYNNRPVQAVPGRGGPTEEPPNNDGSNSSRTISQEEQMQDKYEATMPNDYPTNFDGAAFSSERHQQQPSFEGVSGDGLQSDHLPTITTPRLQSEQTQVPAQKTKISSDLPMIAYSQQVQARPSSRLQEPAPQQTSMLRNYGDKTSDDLRQLAKGALLSLAPHSIHYAELLKEGIDDKILHQLYEELGIEIPAAKVDTSTTSSMEVDDPQPPTSLSAPHKEASQGMDVSALNVPTSSSSIGKPTPVPSPSMERKDRIAQLLAAKTGRPSPVRAFSESATSAGATEQRSTNEAPPNKDNDAVAASPTTQPKSKDVLQAEALKEKMDKLRSESWAAVPLERMNTDGSMSLAKMESANNALQISTQQLPQEAGPLSSIPGLFMTSADPMRIDNIFGTSFGAQSEPIDPSRPSLKRPFEHEVQLSEVEPDAKRRNTETTSDAMDIDRSAESNNAPEGDIISAGKDGPSASDPQSTLQTTAAMLPVSQHTAVFPAPLNPTSIASSQVQPTANQSKTRLTSAQIAEKAEMLKARFLKQRAERQKALQDGLPDLDAEVQKTRTRLVQQQSQLSQVKLQIGKLDAELVEARTQESTLSEEIAQLEKHLKEGVSGQMQYVDELRNLKTDHDTSEQVSRTAPASQQTPPQPTTDVEEVPLIVADEAQESTDRNLTTGPRVQSAEISDGEVSMTSPDSSSENVQPADIEGESNVSEPADLNESPFVGSTVDEHQTPILQNSKILEAELPKPPIPDVPVNGDVPDYVPEPNAVGIDGESDHGEFEHQSDGSASMSDSGSDIGDDEEGEYEPEDEEAPQSNDAEGSEEGEYDPEEIQIEQPVEDGQNDDVEMVEDEYDPELDEAAKDSQAPSSQMSEEMVDSPPARPVENAGQDMKAAEQVIVEAAITPPGEDELLVVAEEPITTLVVSQPSTGVGMPAIASPAPSQEPILTSTASNGTSHASYAPYQSPLSSFQSYRYNEQFKAAAPTAGYRSLTYSNNIDPNVPLCHTELAGGVCEDPTCEDQHFRYLGLSDDKILVSLSSANGIDDKKRRDSYLLELKKIIAQLRKDNVKDFEGVANALSEHRRKFFLEEKREEVS